MAAHRWITPVITALALTLGASGWAHAQPGGAHHHPSERAGPRHDHRGAHQPMDRAGPRHDTRHAHPGGHPAAKHLAPPPGHARGPHYAPKHHAPKYHARGAGPRHQWYAGSRVPPQYRAARHVVHDWRGHRLHQPPRGHHWVRHGNDYMLVAIATGVITQLVLHHLY